VAVDVDAGSRNGFAGSKIDEQGGVFKLIGDEEISLGMKGRSEQCKREKKEHSNR
jgi:hypothetical protein